MRYPLVLLIVICLVAGAVSVIGVPPVLAQCPGLVQVTAGLPDGFAGGTEPTSPSPELQNYCDHDWPQPTTREFDSGGVNTALIHTFSGWRGPVCGATLEIRVRGNNSSLTTNDSIRFQLKGGPDHQRAFLYWTTIRNVTGSWGYGMEATLTFDLSDLPAYVDFPTNILQSLNGGSLDLLVEDDTSVDYATLTVCSCRDNVLNSETVTWGQLKTRYRLE